MLVQLMVPLAFAVIEHMSYVKNIPGYKDVFFIHPLKPKRRVILQLVGKAAEASPILGLSVYKRISPTQIMAVSAIHVTLIESVVMTVIIDIILFVIIPKFLKSAKIQQFKKISKKLINKIILSSKDFCKKRFLKYKPMKLLKQVVKKKIMRRNRNSSVFLKPSSATFKAGSSALFRRIKNL
jgi:hypothetical protein